MKRPKIMIDVTGVGDAVTDLLTPLVSGLGSVHPCRFMGGDRLTQDGLEFKMGKGFFVSRLQVLSESQRIHLPDQLPEAKQLAKEMLDFDIDVDELTGKATYGAIRPGTHDDMVCAIGLACLQDAEPNPGPLVFSGGVRPAPWRDSTSASRSGIPSWLTPEMRRKHAAKIAEIEAAN
jgi:hypothetical protein